MADFEDWFEKYKGWSYSKHNLWQRCKLAFYYRYIGTALKRSDNFDVEKLKVLKGLNPKNAIKGKIVHEIIENQVGMLLSGRDMNEDASNNLLVHKVEQFRKSAKDTIIESYNGEDIDESFFDNMRSDGIDQISIFFNVIWPQFKDYEYKGHEALETINLGDVSCMVKADYISETRDGIVVVTDWKTGKENPKYESELQIGGYALFAREKYEKDPELIRSELVYLTSGAIRSFKFTSEELEAIESKIDADFKEMYVSVEMETFEPTPTKWNCRGCHFATVCEHTVLD